MALPDNYNNKEKFLQSETEYKTVVTNLEQANKEYEIVFEKVMELENKIG